jgi:methyl-accepting chemotaxis protein
MKKLYIILGVLLNGRNHRMFKNLSLKIKLLSLSIGLALALLIVGSLGSFTLQRVSTAYNRVALVNFPKFRALANKRYNSTDLAKNYLRLLGSNLSSDEVSAIKQAIEGNVEKIEKANNAYAEIPFVEGEESMSKTEEAAWKPFVAAARKFVSLYGSKFPDDIQAFQELIAKDLPRLRTAHADALTKLMEFQNQQADMWIKTAQESSRSGAVFSWTVVIVGFFSALILGFLLSTSLAKSLREIATRLSGGAEEVASASQEVSSSSEELSSAATEQAASLVETSASVEEMSAMIGKNAENATQSQKVSTSSQTTADKGKEAVSNMLRAMNDINDSNTEIMNQIEESNHNISEIVKVISEIGNKTKVINEIVFQTKLLSFNASVEAARAGEHGKGFAVVAEEVGNLAQMSGTAAKEITDMLDSSIKKVEGIVHETKSKVERLVQTGKEKVTVGTEVANGCREALDEMVQSIHEVSRMVSEISTASQEQATGVKQINQAIGQLDQATQQNASASQQTASAAEQLSSQADVLRSMVNELMHTIEGRAGKLPSVDSYAKRTKAGNIEKRIFSIQGEKLKRVKETASGKNPPQSSVKLASEIRGVPSREDTRFGT